MNDSKTSKELTAARDAFITEWGAMGSSWGINRTMAQIHALLLVTPDPLCTDEIMEDLKISRGNAHSNLRELVGWGLVRSVIRKGERKEFFVAEKDIWKMFCTIVRERNRREVSPALEVLQSCLEKTRKLKGPEAAEFNKQIKALAEFVGMAGNAMEKLSRAEQSQLLPLALKFLK